MRDISVENSELVGLWLQLLATGAYLVYFPQCVATFQKDKGVGKRRSLWLRIACYLMFVSAITDQVLALVRTYQAFGVHSGLRPDPTAYYANPANPLSAAKNSFNIILTLISDVIFVYRTYVLWNCDYRVIIMPVATVVANFALGVLTIVALLRVKAGDDLIRSDITIRVRYYFVLTFILNLVCSGLICWKIWSTNARVARNMSSLSLGISSGGSYTAHVLETIIQSAGFYCAHLFALIITNVTGTNTFFIFIDPLPPVAGIIFSMLIVRARHPYSSTHSTSPPAAAPRLWGNCRQQLPAGVNIDLERVVHSDTGSVLRYVEDPGSCAYQHSKDIGEAA